MKGVPPPTIPNHPGLSNHRGFVDCGSCRCVPEVVGGVLLIHSLYKFTPCKGGGGVPKLEKCCRGCLFFLLLDFVNGFFWVMFL